MKAQFSAIAALGLGLMTSPAFASDWAVDFTNKSGETVWVISQSGKKVEVHNNATEKVKWSEKGCPASYVIGYFAVYNEEDAEYEDTIVSVSYKYLEKDKCHLKYYQSEWQNDYNNIYETVDKDHGGTTHTRNLTLKQK